jgi:hypothetical protein
MIEKTDLWARLWATLDALGGIAVEYEEENRQLKETIERLRALAANRPDREAKAEELAAEPPLMDFANIPPEQKKAWAEETWKQGRKTVAEMMGWVWNPTDKVWMQGDKRIHPTVNDKWMVSLKGKYLPGTFAELEEAKATFPEERRS